MTAVRVRVGAEASISGVAFTSRRWRMEKFVESIPYSGYSDTTAVTLDGDSSASIVIEGVLSDNQSADDLRDDLTVTATAYTGEAYTQTVKVRSVSSRFDKTDDGRGETVWVIQGVIEDMTSGSFLNPA